MTELECMLTSILDCARTDIYAKDYHLTLEQNHQLEMMKERRAAGEPLQYILGEWDFMGLTLKINEDVLIPRPETEQLIETVVQYHSKNILNPDRHELQALELGTGSGNIAISLAEFLPNALITTVDVSAEALQLAFENAKNLGVDQKIHFVHKCMKEFLKASSFGQKLFDIIISNPPYIKTSDIKVLPLEVRKEPCMALDGGPDGLEYIRYIIEHSHSILRKNGLLALEIGDEQRASIEQIFNEYPQYASVQFLQDYGNSDRILLCSKK